MAKKSRYVKIVVNVDTARIYLNGQDVDIDLGEKLWNFLIANKLIPDNP